MLENLQLWVYIWYSINHVTPKTNWKKNPLSTCRLSSLPPISLTPMGQFLWANMQPLVSPNWLSSHKCLLHSTSHLSVTRFKKWTHAINVTLAIEFHEEWNQCHLTVILLQVISYPFRVSCYDFLFASFA